MLIYLFDLFLYLLLGFIAKVKDKAENVGQKIQAKAESAGFGGISPLIKRKDGADHESKSGSRPKDVGVKKSLTMEIAQLFMSCLHAWGQVNNNTLIKASLEIILVSKASFLFGMYKNTPSPVH